jgi:MFS family permease
MSKETDKPKIFHGWFVVIACFFVTMSLGETMWSFGVFFKPLEDEFHWSRTLVSSGYTAFLISYSLSSILAGKISDRYDPRWVLIVSGALAGIGISLCSQVQSVNELRGFLSVAGLGAGATWSVPTSIVQRWFYGRRRAGLALAIVVAGVGIGALIFAPLINYFILSYGWRNAFLITGILFLVIIAAAAPAVRPSPAEARVSFDQEKSAPLIGDMSGLTTTKVVTHASFLILAFAACVSIFTFQVISVHLIPYVTDLGISPTAAATAVGLTGAFSIPGRLLAGPLSDRIGWKKTIIVSLFGMTAATLWLFFSKMEWMLYGFAFVFGIFWGIRSTAFNGALGAFFGMRLLGELIGITTATGNILAAFVPYIAGYIFDTAGSYSLVFISLAVLLFGVGLLATTLKEPHYAISRP